jgi:hypothetical protein
MDVAVQQTWDFIGAEAHCCLPSFEFQTHYHGKGKTRLGGQLIKHYAIKTYGGIAPAFLTMALDGSEWSTSRIAALPPDKELPSPSLDRRLGGPHSQSGRCGEEKNLTLRGN